MKLKQHHQHGIQWVPLAIASMAIVLFFVSPVLSKDELTPGEFARWLAAEMKLITIDLPSPS